jgi:hypothetical protein
MKLSTRLQAKNKVQHFILLVAFLTETSVAADFAAQCAAGD